MGASWDDEHMSEVPARVWFDPNTGRLQVTITEDRPVYHWRPDVKVVEVRFERPQSGGWHTELTLRAGKPTKVRGGVLHQITMTRGGDGDPVPQHVAHPPRCDLLAYGQQCHYDLLLDDGYEYPDAAGVYTARIVPAREPNPGEVYVESDEIHYERIGDA